jgi:two-component system, NtrC family, response regulator AtoC
VSSKELPTELVPRVGAGERVLLASVDGQLTVIELPENGKLTIGRGEDCDVVLDHPSISRKHATVEIGEQLRIEDLGSANGTFVGGVRIAASKPVGFGPGVLVELGSVLITQRGGEEAVVARPAADMVIADPVMVEVHETVRVAATSSLSILLLGETGVGKELFARRIHELSPRAAASLVRVNCAALVESLLEAELFGHERGAFTGATQAKAGLLEAASGGTLFLDEVGELPLTTQAKLLRVLESGEVTRVGAVKPRSVDVRFVAATHRDLAVLVANGRFREDLFFRLDGVAIRIPPLRERVAEILPLAESFVIEAGQASGQPPPTLAADAAARLRGHPWPGNVRELRNVIMRSVLFCRDGVLTAAGLRMGTIETADSKPSAAPAAATTSVAGGAPAGMSTERAERRARAIDALEKTVWNQTRAAELLGITRRTLQTWMIDLDIPRPRGGK